MLRCFHGLGDTIQFIRYAKLLAVLARAVTLVAQPELVPLVRTMNSGFNPLFRCRGVAAVGDVEVKLVELPHVFRTTFATIPCEIPYFHVNPKQFAQNALLNVGLVWKSGVWDKRRSVPFELVRRLGAIRGVNWYILQRGDALGEWDGGFGVNSGSDDVLEAARVIAGLDLLISVDSMPAHLDGALGVPTWTLLHSDPDWRWMLGRSESPSYATMRLFRQARAGDWQSVITRVRKALCARIAANNDNRGDDRLTVVNTSAT
ncbi:MAG TPA: hypothetical protein VE758_04200 [Chthoniobacterales bacterium]|nr:hypothetical protein [Chthoniobacterales bacterium]